MQRSPLTEMSRLHVFFDLTGVLVVKRVVESHMQMPNNLLLTLMHRLKDFLTSFLAQFEVYI
jgi:hypothetical protein